MLKFLIVFSVFASVVMPLQAADKSFGQRSIMSESSIAERVKRHGAVCLEGEPCIGQLAAASQEEEPAEPAGPRAGDAIYNSYCAGCHISGAAGAPKVGDAKAWESRISKHGGEEGLWKSSWAGVGMMPAKGMCNDCSEEEFASAVSYMLTIEK